MDWPRLQLTPGEAQRWCVYSEPKKIQRAALYRVYAGELRFTPTVQEDTEAIQISRRSRIFAITASGDVHNTEIVLYDSSGEQYTMGFIPMTNLLPGMNNDPRGLPNWYDDLNIGVFTTGTTITTQKKRLTTGLLIAAGCTAPHILEPNIVLAPNQTLSVKGRAINPPQVLTAFNPANGAELLVTEVVHLSFCVHVWEFPLE